MKKLLIVCSLTGSLILFSCSNNNTEKNKNTPSSATATTAEEGKDLFKMMCSACHLVDRDLVGPALKGVEERWANKQDLYEFIRNPNAVIEKNDYAKNLWLKHNKTQMTPYPQLTNEQIDAILAYVNEEAAKAK